MKSDRYQRDPRYRHAFDTLGKRWVGLILRILLRGPLHFNELTQRIDGMSDPVLSARLKELIQEGIIKRGMHAGPPVRVVYCLTEKGYALRPVIEAITSWSMCWIDSDTSSTSTNCRCNKDNLEILTHGTE